MKGYLARLFVLMILAGCAVRPQASSQPTAALVAPPHTAVPALPSSTPPPTVTPEIATATPTAPLVAEYVVVIVLDAARPDYLDAAKMPALRELIANGAFSPAAWVGAMENSTPAGHTQISTGVFPNRSGITGHLLRNNSTGVNVEITDDGYILNGQFAALVQSSGVPTLAGLIKARYPDGTVIALSGDKHYSAQSLGVGPADFVLYTHRSDDGNGSVSLRALPGRSPGEALLADGLLHGTVSAPGDLNAFTLSAARLLFERFAPRALLISLPETDDLGHASGADSAVIAPALEKTDQALSGLIEGYRAAGIFDQSLWVITADHGMSAKFDVIDPEALLDGVGVALEEGEPKRLPSMYLNDPTRAPGIAAQIAGGGLPVLQGVYYRVAQGQGYSYMPAYAAEGLGATYAYLLGTYATATTPDVVVFAADGAVFDDTLNPNGGEHTMTNWHNQHIPLILSGAGVQPGVVSYAPARLVDVLPTIAQAMGLDLTGGLDGVALTDGLANPPANAVAAQSALNAWLAPLRDALEASAMR